MALVVVLTLGAMGVLADDARDRINLPDNPLQGRILFEQKGCYSCHSIGGGEQIGPDFTEDVVTGTFLDVGAELWNHALDMSLRLRGLGKPWPHFSKQEVVELTAFLYYLNYLGQPGDPKLGREVLVRKQCLRCHAIGGQGGTTGPALDQLSEFASPLAVVRAIWNHGPAMSEAMRELGTPRPQFRGEDFVNLSAYIRQASLVSLQERSLLSPGNPNAGKTTFEQRGCATCHGQHGEGGTGPDLTQIELAKPATTIAALMWNHSFAMREAMNTKRVKWPEFTTKELADLVAFLYFLGFEDPEGDRRRGEEVFEAKRCALCHVQGPTEQRIAPDLTASAVVARDPTSFVSAMWNHAPVMEAAVIETGRQWPVLSGTDLRDLVAFLRQTVHRSDVDGDAPAGEAARAE